MKKLLELKEYFLEVEQSHLERQNLDLVTVNRKLLDLYENAKYNVKYHEEVDKLLRNQEVWKAYSRYKNYY